MAGTIDQITNNSIQTIRPLIGKPIYFVRLNSGQELVLKGENSSANQRTFLDKQVSIAWSAKLMKNVQNRIVNVKILKPSEFDELRRAVANAVATGTFTQNEDYITGLENNFIWVKMLKVNNLTDAEFWKDTAPGPDIIHIKKIIRRLLDFNTWQAIGNMVAVDLFNGNTDRFNGQGEFVNRGNLMFSGGQIVGLDTYDPSRSADWSNLNRFSRQGDWANLDILRDNHLVPAFSETAVRSVGNELADGLAHRNLGGHFITLEFDTIIDEERFLRLSQEDIQTLFVPYRDNFAAGLRLGRDNLRAYLLQKIGGFNPNGWARGNGVVAPRANNGMLGGGRIQQAPQPAQGGGGWNAVRPNAARGNAGIGGARRQGPLPQGIIDRMNYLGWI